MGKTTVRSEQITDATITDADVATANKDGVAGTASMRTLGTGATQAAAGNHTHAYTDVLSVPSGTVAGRLTAGSGVLEAMVAPIPFCMGRLTTSTGTPVMNTDQVSATNIYLTAYNGCHALVPNATTLVLRSFSADVSLSLLSLTSGKNYDVFLWDNAGTLTLKLGTAWASDTARVSGSAGALETWNNIQTNQYAEGSMSARCGLFLGTLRTTASNTTEDSMSKRFLWNRYNRVTRPLVVKESADSWTYGTATWRSYNNSTANRFEYVVGMYEEHPIRVDFMSFALWTTTGASPAVGIGLDSTSSPASGSLIVPGYGGWTSGVVSMFNPVSAHYLGYPGAGYHYFQQLEQSRTGITCTFYGDNATPTTSQSGMFGTIMG